MNEKKINILPDAIREFYIKKGYDFCNPNMTIPANIVMNFIKILELRDYYDRLLLNFKLIMLNY